MKYLCLIYQDDAKLDTLPDSEYNEVVADTLAYREELKQSGHYITSSPLQPPRTAATIRVRNSKMTITDGPFTETREYLAGFYLIEASDLNDAIRLAAQMPPARIGSIEVRALQDLAPRSES
jgi:hypothetical protein